MTKQQLPPEDQPSGQGLIPAPDPAATVAAEVARNHLDGAWEAGRAFFLALTDNAGARLDDLTGMVTPESLAAWGDFSGARELLTDATMTTRADIPAPGAAYVKFVSDPGQVMVSDGYTPIMVRARATLQFRLETGRWQVFTLSGNYFLPENLPALPGGGSPN